MNDSLVRRIRHYLPGSIAAGLPKKIKVIHISSQVSRKLNQTYRRKKHPTNVLSFRYDDSYGEIVICPSIVRREARQRGVSYRLEMTRMVVHAMLHLAGVHHERSKKADIRFLQVERQILSKLFPIQKFKAPSTKSQTNSKN